MKIIILGSKGMLGQMALSYFSPKYETVIIDERYTFETRLKFLSKISNAGEGFIINCIGKIKQKSSNSSELFFTNSLLPLDIYNSLTEQQFLIQPSTDCVFSGDTSEWYDLKQNCDAIDDYGQSKRLGELSLLNKEKAFIVRVSIIGSDNLNKNPTGLLGWFLNNKENSDILGYTNHFWNGITTLEWCKKVEEIIIKNLDNDLFGKIIQLGTTELRSKYELLLLFQKIFKTKFNISAFETGINVNRCLKPIISSKNLEQQLIELKEFINV